MDNASVSLRPTQFTERPEASEETLRRVADSDAGESSLTPRGSSTAKVKKKKKAKRVKTQNQQGEVNEGQEGKGGVWDVALVEIQSQDVRMSRLRFWFYMQHGLTWPFHRKCSG